MSNQFRDSIREFITVLDDVDLDGIATHLNSVSGGAVEASFFPNTEKEFNRLIEFFPLVFERNEKRDKYETWETDAEPFHGASEITIFRWDAR